jgi:hypothetical protein
MKKLCILGFFFLINVNATTEYFYVETIGCSISATRSERVIQYQNKTKYCSGGTGCNVGSSIISAGDFTVSEEATFQSRPRNTNFYLVSNHSKLDITNKECNKFGTSSDDVKKFLTTLYVTFEDGSSLESGVLCTCFYGRQIGRQKD